jgi:hypothetical protein
MLGMAIRVMNRAGRAPRTTGIPSSRTSSSSPARPCSSSRRGAHGQPVRLRAVPSRDAAHVRGDGRSSLRALLCVLFFACSCAQAHGSSRKDGGGASIAPTTRPPATTQAHRWTHRTARSPTCVSTLAPQAVPRRLPAGVVQRRSAGLERAAWLTCSRISTGTAPCRACEPPRSLVLWRRSLAFGGHGAGGGGWLVVVLAAMISGSLIDRDRFYGPRDDH